jgi:hypothetical protein
VSSESLKSTKKPEPEEIASKSKIASKSVSPAVKEALADLAAEARAAAAVKAAQVEMRLMKEAEALEAEVAAARASAPTRLGTPPATADEEGTGVPALSRDPASLLMELAETREHLDASDATRRAAERDLDLAERASRELERENDELRRRLVTRDARDASEFDKPRSGLERTSAGETSGCTHEEIFELRRRISNLNAEVQLCEIEKEKLRQLREAAEKRRSEAEARFAIAEVEVARSRASISRLASLETDLHRVSASKDAAEEKHRAEIRASVSEAERLNARLAAEVRYYKEQLEKKREKKRLHKQKAYEVACKLKEAVSIAKDTAMDCERAIARAKSESARAIAHASTAENHERVRDAASSAAAAAAASSLAEALEKKRAKKREYKSRVESLERDAIATRNETNRYRTALMNARKVCENERNSAEMCLARLEMERASDSERSRSRVSRLEEALKRAAKDYKKLSSERAGFDASARVAAGKLEAASVENARLVSCLSRMEDTAKRHREDAERLKVSLTETRAALRKAEEEFVLRLARDRRAWEQAAASRGEYVEFDPYAKSARDGRPRQPPKGGRDGTGLENIDDASLVAETTSASRETRPAGMSSAHLERVATREKKKYAQRQKDLAMGVRAEYLEFSGK